MKIGAGILGILLGLASFNIVLFWTTIIGAGATYLGSMDPLWHGLASWGLNIRVIGLAGTMTAFAGGVVTFSKPRFGSGLLGLSAGLHYALLGFGSVGSVFVLCLALAAGLAFMASVEAPEAGLESGEKPKPGSASLPEQEPVPGLAFTDERTADKTSGRVLAASQVAAPERAGNEPEAADEEREAPERHEQQRPSSQPLDLDAPDLMAEIRDWMFASTLRQLSIIGGIPAVLIICLGVIYQMNKVVVEHPKTMFLGASYFKSGNGNPPLLVALDQAVDVASGQVIGAIALRKSGEEFVVGIYFTEQFRGYQIVSATDGDDDLAKSSNCGRDMMFVDYNGFNSAKLYCHTPVTRSFFVRHNDPNDTIKIVLKSPEGKYLEYEERTHGPQGILNVEFAAVGD